MKLPQTKTENLLEQHLAGETLIYDLSADKAFNLNETSTIVYKACCEELTFEQLKRASKFPDEVIYLALDELKRNDLLAGANYVSPFAGMNRREVIKKVGLASLIALPVITGLTMPTAAHAASNCPDPFSASGIPTGCTAGGGVSDPQSCAAQSDASRGGTCNAFTVIRSRCASNTATYGGTCTDTGPDSSYYNCVCA